MIIKEASDYGVDTDGYIVYLTKAEMLATVAVTGWIDKGNQEKHLRWWTEFNALMIKKLKGVAGKAVIGMSDYNALKYIPCPYKNEKGQNTCPQVKHSYAINHAYLDEAMEELNGDN